MADTADALAALRETFDKEADSLRGLQREMEKLAEGRQTYLSQIGENEMVAAELALLEDGAKVFKLMGSVLVPQDLGEAREAVKKRLEFMNADLKRSEKRLEAIEKKRMEKQNTMQKLQMDYRQRQQLQK